MTDPGQAGTARGGKAGSFAYLVLRTCLQHTPCKPLSFRTCQPCTCPPHTLGTALQCLSRIQSDTGPRGTDCNFDTIPDRFPADTCRQYTVHTAMLRAGPRTDHVDNQRMRCSQHRSCTARLRMGCTMAFPAGLGSARLHMLRTWSRRFVRSGQLRRRCTQEAWNRRTWIHSPRQSAQLGTVRCTTYSSAPPTLLGIHQFDTAGRTAGRWTVDISPAHMICNSAPSMCLGIARWDKQHMQSPRSPDQICQERSDGTLLPHGHR